MVTYVMHHPRGRGLGTHLLAFANHDLARAFVSKVNDDVSAEAEIVSAHEARRYLYALAKHGEDRAYGTGVYLRHLSGDRWERESVTEARRHLAAVDLSLGAIDIPGLVAEPVEL